MNANEKAVLVALAKNAIENSGGSFGLLGRSEIDHRALKLTEKQLGGYIRDLQKKGLIEIHASITVNLNDKVVQFELDPEAWQLAFQLVIEGAEKSP